MLYLKLFYFFFLLFISNPPLANINIPKTPANPTSPVFGFDGFLFVVVVVLLGFLFVWETFIIFPSSFISKSCSVLSNTYPAGAVISW